MSWPRLPPDERVDVGLLLEGTYPFVSGGVSSWIHEIVSGLPELSFGIVFLGGSAATTGDIKYRRPANLVHLEVHHLMDALGEAPSHPRRRVRARGAWRGGGPRDPADAEAEALRPLGTLHELMRDPARPVPPELLQALGELDGEDGLALPDFLGGDAAWAFFCREYQIQCPEASFLDFFWTTRIMHTPLFALARIARSAPRFRMLHAVSTGYAGYLGALLAEQRQRPFVLTEHGIYTKERKIDLAQASWIRDGASSPSASALGLSPARQLQAGAGLGPLRRMWIDFFQTLGRLAYAAADPIISLYEGNRRRQIADGADPPRTRVVPNGIDIARFQRIGRDIAVDSETDTDTGTGPRAPAMVLGLVGRVVPIKDIKTFIRAVHAVQAELPEAEGWIIGPEDEDPRYAEECHALVETLGLHASIRFLGFQRAEDILPRLGVLVLSSISEALPLVILEAFAAGVPVVATDVGACRALVEGRADVPADRQLGSAGAITHIASPDETARAALALLRDPVAWHRAGVAGSARVNASYARERMFAAYREVYAAALEKAGAGNGWDRLRAS